MLYVGRAVFYRGARRRGRWAAAAFSDSTRWDVELALERGGWFARAEYLRQDRRTPADHRDGWYALTTYTFRPQRAQLVGRVEQFDPGATPGNTRTGYTLGGAVFLPWRRLEARRRLYGLHRTGHRGERQSGHRTDASAMVTLAALLAQTSVVILATTTSTRDAGLLDSLLPVFEQQTRYTVKVIAVGSGQALAMGRRGDADVVLSHAPDAERALVDSGYFVRRRLVMHNEFLIVGPARDPAGLRGLSDPVAAVRSIAERRALFVSRAINRARTSASSCSGSARASRSRLEASGTSNRGRAWARRFSWPTKARLHAHRPGHLSDVARQAAARPHGRGDSLLYNVYHVLELNPKNASRINVAGGEALADFLVAPETQRLIVHTARAASARACSCRTRERRRLARRQPVSPGGHRRAVLNSFGARAVYLEPHGS